MKLLPFESFQIDTALSTNEVIQIINENTEERKFFNFNSSYEFSGKVDNDSFEIIKIYHIKTLFYQLLKGNVKNPSMALE